jgi:hypothetical protein
MPARDLRKSHVIYTSEEPAIPEKHGRQIICYFGETGVAGKVYDDDIPWNGKKVDIWSVDVMVSFFRVRFYGGRNMCKSFSKAVSLLVISILTP